MTDAGREPAVFSVRSSRSGFRGAVTAIRVDEVVMPGGGTALREVVEHDRAVAVVALADSSPDPEVVLIEQYRHPLGRKLWELPAGLMDVADEPPLLAAQRELGEETGLAAADWHVLVDVATSPGFTEEVVRVYLATGLTHIGRQGEIEHEEADLRIVRVRLSEAVAAVLDGRIVNATAAAGLLAASVARAATLRPATAPWSPGSLPSADGVQAPFLGGARDQAGTGPAAG